MSRFMMLAITFAAAFIGTYHMALTLYGSRSPSSAFSSPSSSSSSGQSASISQADDIASERQRFEQADRSSSSPSSSSDAPPPTPATSASVVAERPRDKLAVSRPRKRFHTAMTCDSSGYSKWQSRIMYHYYKQWRDHPESDMGDFTRVLHTGSGDELVDEIPTFIVDPLPEGELQGYVVLNRPYAFVQWITRAEFDEEYVWMAEPDHLIVRPIPNLAVEDSPSAFPFFYINPSEYETVLRKYFTDRSRPIADIDPVGNSPVILKKEQLRKLAPQWHNFSMAMKRDADADKAFGWVLEMYAYATAAANVGIRHLLHRNWMVQPPWDQHLGDTYLIHYTYGCDYTLEGVHLPDKVGPWHFDKRDYDTSIPRNLSLPPKGAPETVVRLITMLNDATAAIPDWKAGVE